MTPRVGSPRAAAPPGADLLERDTDVAVLGERIRRAAGGCGAVALIEGPAGIGKTRLLASALDDAAQRGVQRASARGSPLEQEFGFGVVRQLFEQPLAGLESPQRARITSGAAALAGPVFAASVTGDAPKLADTHAVLHGLHWLVANLSTCAPLVITVDDAHWADAPSLRFLAYLVNRIAALPVMLAVAARASESGATGEALDEIASAPVTTTLRPAPFTPAAVADLVESSLAPDPEPDFVQTC